MSLGLPCVCGNVVVATPERTRQQVPCPACGNLIGVPALGAPARLSAAPPSVPASVPEEEESRSRLGAWLAIAGGGVLILAALVALIVWCYGGTAPDSFAQSIAPAPDKQGEKNLIVPMPSGPALVKEEPKTVKELLPTIKPLEEPKKPLPVVVAKDPPKEVAIPTPPVKTPAPILPAKAKEEKQVIPIFVTEDFKEAKVPYRLRYLKLPEDFKPKTLRLAVTPPVYDDMGKLLTDLGEGFRNFANLTINDLGNLERLKQFDVVFLTCGDSPATGGEIQALRKFVEGGGTLYASDLRYEMVLSIFPEMKPSYNVQGGNGNQTIKAEVVDSGLRQYLGRNAIPLHFNLDGWRPAIFDRKKTKSVLEGKYYPQGGGQPILARLLVKFRAGEGNVVFTSFHNAAQNNELERKLLKYLVVTAVTAKQEAKVQDLLIKEGFALVDLKNQQLSKGRTTAKQAINHTKGGLQFAVGYDTLGAKLKLTLTAPDGQKIEHEEAAMFLLEIPSAAAGTWSYTVTATAVPFANFPFVLAVGKKN